MNTTKHKHILPKGSSCATCKARKVKCDAIKPACTACKRSARHRHEDPELVRCCYATPRRKESATRGVGGLPTPSPHRDENSSRSLRPRADVQHKVEGAKEVVQLGSPAHENLGECLGLPCAPCSDDYPGDISTSFATSSGTLSSFPHISQRLSTAAPSSNEMDLFAYLPTEMSLPKSIPIATFPGSLSPTTSFPSSVQSSLPSSAYYEHRDDLEPFWSPTSSSISSSSSSSSSSQKTNDTLYSLSTFDSFDSLLDLNYNPFSLVDELSFYDSSVPTSPGSYEEGSSFRDDVDGLALPLFPPQPLHW